MITLDVVVESLIYSFPAIVNKEDKMIPFYIDIATVCVIVLITYRLR